MKTQSMDIKKIFIVLLALALILTAVLAVSCARDGEEKKPKKAKKEETLPLMSNMASEESLKEVTDALSAAGLSNVGMFSEWVSDFNTSAGKDAGLVGDWTAPGTSEVDMLACMTGWEDDHDYSDADCRITAFTLIQDALSYETVDDYYGGTYLMFDIDAIMTADRYAHLRESQAAYNTLFGETSLSYGTKPDQIYADKWKEYGFDLDCDGAQLLNLLVFDGDTREYFVGHTGLLLPQPYGYLFVEKLAFQQPYQATKVKDMDQLLALLGQRPEYFGEEGDEPPLVYQNGDFVSELKAQ